MGESLKVFEAFAGVGCQHQALKNIGVNFEVVGISEIDKYAIKSYEALHGKVKNYGDITKLDMEDLPNFDLLTTSFPCFVEGTKIMTDKGYKNIEDINTGDKVLTHTNSYQEVVKPMINEANHLYKIDTMCSETLYTTEEHPFYIRKRYREWDNDKRMYDRKFEKPKWIKAKDLNKDCYVGIAINQESKLPNWEGVTFKWKGHRKERHSTILNDKFNMPEFWWLIGRYIGDGWIRSQGGIIICCAYGEENEIISKLDILGFNYLITNERTVIKIHIAFKEIGAYVTQFGRGASNKHLTNDIFNLPIDLLKEFIEGYKSADGFVDRYGLNKINSVSKDLIYGIGQCIAKAYQRPFSIYHTKRNPTHIIEGRTVHQKDTYTVTWKYECKKQDKAFYDGKYIWCPINKVEKIDYDGLVYNMEVSNDNSYTVNNIIVHNCQDISIAGKLQGLEKGSETRSSLLWHCERIIKSKRPKYILLENVKNLVGKKFIEYFKIWLKILEGYGYTNYWKVLNAKDYGVPQNRERVFCISILGEHKPFEFPEREELKVKLKDLLEDHVDEKYFLNEEQVKRIHISTYCAAQRRIQEKDWCDTLCARDWKDPKCVKVEQIGKLSTSTRDNSQRYRVYSSEGLSPTLNTMQGGGLHPHIVEDEESSQEKSSNYRVRKLTPRECWRLMGFSDDAIDKAFSSGNSNTQLYKQAGNGIVVTVLERLFENLFK